MTSLTNIHIREEGKERRRKGKEGRIQWH